MPVLFEFGDWEPSKDIGSLKSLLTKIWSQWQFVDSEFKNRWTELNEGARQPYLQIDDGRIRASNFVGFLQNGDELVEIYPKVFRSVQGSIDKKELMLRHIFYWLGYCKKWRFPFTKADLEAREIDSFPELIINRIADQFFEGVSKKPLTIYQASEDVLVFPRGTINFKRYIANSLSKGKLQNIECDHEPFLFDNQINRIIKHCTRMLLKQTKYAENIRLLQETLFVLDEVEDVSCSVSDIERSKLNPFFADYQDILGSCRIILNHQLYASSREDLSQWCLLFPMECIFEEFFAGFLESKFHKGWKIEYQKSDAYLCDFPKAFNIQHDIFLTGKGGSGRKIIVDTKYKVRDPNFRNELKKGISQADLYQVVCYAFKRGCSDVILVYPNLAEEINPVDKFEIISGFAGHEAVNVYAVEIPFWSFDDLNGLDKRLQFTFENLLNTILGKG